MVVNGPIARHAVDAAAFLDAVAEGPFAPTTLSGLRIAMTLKPPPGMGGKLDEERRRAIEEAADALRSLGHSVKERDPTLPRSVSLAIDARYFGGIAEDIQALDEALDGCDLMLFPGSVQGPHPIGRFHDRGALVTGYLDTQRSLSSRSGTWSAAPPRWSPGTSTGKGSPPRSSSAAVPAPSVCCCRWSPSWNLTEGLASGRSHEGKPLDARRSSGPSGSGHLGGDSFGVGGGKALGGAWAVVRRGRCAEVLGAQLVHEIPPQLGAAVGQQLCPHAERGRCRPMTESPGSERCHHWHELDGRLGEAVGRPSAAADVLSGEQAAGDEAP